MDNNTNFITSEFKLNLEHINSEQQHCKSWYVRKNEKCFESYYTVIKKKGNAVPLQVQGAQRIPEVNP